MNQSDAPDAGTDAAYEAKLRADFDGQSRDDVLRDYREMLRIRRFEEAAARAYTRAGRKQITVETDLGARTVAMMSRLLGEQP